VIGRDMPLDAEAVEQRLLHPPPLAHHRRISSTKEKGISVSAPRSSGVLQRNSQTAVLRRQRGERAKSAPSGPSAIVWARFLKLNRSTSRMCD
jgi:hypothetical protein